MTEALSVGPDVNAILGSDGAELGTVVSSNFSESGAGQVEIAPATPSEAPEPEKLIAGKFKSQEDLVKAYKALESKLGQSAEETPTEPESSEAPLQMGSEEGQEEAGEETEARSSEDEEEGSGLDLSPYQSEFAENGELSEESFKSLADAGIPREMVETYVQGIQAIQQTRAQELYASAGGEDQFKALVGWGTANLPQEQQEAFNAAVTSAISVGDMTQASMLVQAVRAQMGAGEPQLLNTNTGTPATGAEPFESRSAMAAAMRDPRYSKDAAYVAQVQARLAVSDF